MSEKAKDLEAEGAPLARVPLTDIAALHEGDFKRMASEDYPSLLLLIEKGVLTNVQTTFAAEACQRIIEPRHRVGAVKRVLLPLLDNPAAVVREGAVYGLLAHVDDEVRARLRRTVEFDPSRAVREVAADALDDGEP